MVHVYWRMVFRASVLEYGFGLGYSEYGVGQWENLR
jgi:hypothetical protein